MQRPSVSKHWLFTQALERQCKRKSTCLLLQQLNISAGSSKPRVKVLRVNHVLEPPPTRPDGTTHGVRSWWQKHLCERGLDWHDVDIEDSAVFWNGWAWLISFEHQSLLWRCYDRERRRINIRQSPDLYARNPLRRTREFGVKINGHSGLQSPT